MIFQHRNHGRRCRSVFSAFLLGTALLTASVVEGQSQPGEVQKVSIVVRDVSTEGQLIRVPVNKSILVDFSVPVREVRLAKPEFAEIHPVSPLQILITGKAFGTTQMIAWLTTDDQRVFDVAVDLELERLMASIRTTAPRARVKAHALLDSVVLTGQVPDAETAERIIEIASVFSPRVLNQMHVSGAQQVLLRCTIAEVNRSAARNLGFNGWMGGDDFRDMFFVNNLDGINPANIGAPQGALMTADIPFVVGEEGIPITGRSTMSFGFPRAQMQIFVQALRENGLLRVLAEPNLIAINGQEASFLAGGEIPIPIVTDEKVKVEFKEFGVKLNFTPAVLAEDRIRLNVTPEVSEPDFANSVTIGGIAIPGFSTRRIETVVELGSGQTFAIGGLLSERVRAVSRQIPGLGDIPVLGALFSSKDYQIDESELVVLVTPELVSPLSPDQITSIPGGNYIVPNDFELFLMGELDGRSGQELPVLQPRVNQSWPARPSELYGSDTTTKIRGPLGPAGEAEGS